MFTGLIEELGEIVALAPHGDAARLTVRGPLATSDATHGLITSRGGGTPEIEARVDRARTGPVGDFNTLIEKRRGEESDDLLGVLIAAEEDGDRGDQPDHRQRLDPRGKGTDGGLGSQRAG